MRWINILVLCLTLPLFAEATSLFAQAPPALENALEGSMKKGAAVKVSKDWKRKVFYGDWSVQEDGSLKTVNVAEQGHGPLMTFSAPIDDAVIECEFMLPEEGPDRHFRIFLACPEYLGHTVGAVANISTNSFPLGLKLNHQRKGKNNKVEADVEFDTNPLALKGGQWHAMRLKLQGDEAIFSVDSVELTGTNDVLGIRKDRLSLNFGKAGGSVRNFQISAINDE